MSRQTNAGYQLPDEALPREAYVLSVPFAKQVNRWEASLDDRHLPYKAVLRSDLPYVDFVFDERLPEATIDRLNEKYGDWSEARSPSEPELPTSDRTASPFAIDIPASGLV